MDRELFRFGDTKSPLVVTLSYFNTMRGVDIRRHYYDKKNGVTKPTQKGIWLKEDEFFEILDALKTKLDEITDFFKDDLSSGELKTRSTLLESNSRRQVLNSTKNVIVDVAEWPGTKFFEYVNEGNKHQIILNKKNIIFKKIDSKSVKTIGNILFAFIKARIVIDIPKSEQIIDILEAEWGNQVNHIKEDAV